VPSIYLFNSYILSININIRFFTILVSDYQHQYQLDFLQFLGPACVYKRNCQIKGTNNTNGSNMNTINMRNSPLTTSNNRRVEISKSTGCDGCRYQLLKTNHCTSM
jgi:hypothetical protein